MSEENYKKAVEEIRRMEEADEQERQRQERIEELYSEIIRISDEYEKWLIEIVDSDRARSLKSAYQKGATDTLKLLGYE